MVEDLFSVYYGKEVKAIVRDGVTTRIVRGVLIGITDTHLQVRGQLGTIIFLKENVEKMALAVRSL